MKSFRNELNSKNVENCSYCMMYKKVNLYGQETEI